MTATECELAVTNCQTLDHIQKVQHYLHRFSKSLLDRAEEHDQSKLSSPEVDLFTEFTPKLRTSTFKDGINDMNLLDIVEMLCDWRASSQRHNDGNIRKSIEINANRFGLSPQLVRILENTVDFLED